MYLNETIQKKLRDIGKISSDEVLLKEGDLFVAVNVITSVSRILQQDKTLIEAISDTKNSHTNNSKRILKG